MVRNKARRGRISKSKLGQSVGYYEASKRAQTGGSKRDKHPYFNDPYHWGPAPFPYAFPGEWGDPAFMGM